MKKYTYAELYRIWSEDNSVPEKFPTREEMETHALALGTEADNILEQKNYFFKEVFCVAGDNLFNYSIFLEKGVVKGHLGENRNIHNYPKLVQVEEEWTIGT